MNNMIVDCCRPMSSFAMSDRVKWGDSDGDIKRLNDRLTVSQLLGFQNKNLQEAMISVIFTITGAENYLSFPNADDTEVIGTYAANCKVLSTRAIADLLDMERATVMQSCEQPVGTSAQAFDGKWFAILPKPRGKTGKRSIVDVDVGGPSDDESGPPVAEYDENDPVLRESSALFAREVVDEIRAKTYHDRAVKANRARQEKRATERERAKSSKEAEFFRGFLTGKSSKHVPLGKQPCIASAVVPANGASGASTSASSVMHPQPAGVAAQALQTATLEVPVVAARVVAPWKPSGNAAPGCPSLITVAWKSSKPFDTHIALRQALKPYGTVFFKCSHCGNVCAWAAGAHKHWNLDKNKCASLRRSEQKLGVVRKS